MTDISCPLVAKSITQPDAMAIHTDRCQLTYSQLNRAINGAVNYLGQSGIEENDCVGILSQNPMDTIILQWALWRLKAIAMPLSCQLPKTTLQQRLKFLKVQTVLISHFDLDLDLDITILNCQNTHEFSKQLELDVFLNKDPEVIQWDTQQPVTVIFTSGSSAAPKAAVMSFGNHYYNALGSNQHIPLNRDDRWLLSLPLHHVSGQAIVMRCICAGSSVFIQSKTRSLLDSIMELSITHISVVPTQLQRLLDQSSAEDLNCLKACLIGGSAISKNLIRQSLDRNIPLYTSYGLTEMASQVATSEILHNSTEKSHAQILPYRKLKIATDNEILVRGECLFLGYQTPNGIESALNSQGWFPTGDLGWQTADGQLEVYGRKDNMFISGGENIQPEEIENILKNIPEVRQAIIIPEKDAEFGFHPIAFIDFGIAEALSKTQLHAHLKPYLEKFKIPLRFYQIPMRMNGALKFSRVKLIKRFQEAQSSMFSESLFNEIL